MGNQSPLGKGPLWKTEGLGLPGPLRSLVRHLRANGITGGRAYAVAISQARKWAAKGNPRWVKVVAQFEAARAKAKATPNRGSTRTAHDVDPSAVLALAADDTHPVPQAVQSAARHALDLIRQGKAGDGFTSVGRARAAQLAAGKPVSTATVRQINAYFARHASGDRGQQHTPGTPAATAWAAWGGNAGRRWAASIVNRAGSNLSASHTPAVEAAHDPTETALQLAAASADGCPSCGAHLALAASGGHHIPGTDYNWSHGYEPLNAKTALNNKKGKKAAGSLSDAGHVNAGSGGRNETRARRAPTEADHAAIRGSDTAARRQTLSELSDDGLDRARLDGLTALTPRLGDSTARKKALRRQREDLEADIATERGRRGPTAPATPRPAAADQPSFVRTLDDGATLRLKKSSFREEWSFSIADDGTNPRGVKNKDNEFPTREAAEAAAGEMADRHNAAVKRAADSDRERQERDQAEAQRSADSAARANQATSAQVDAIMRELSKRQRDFGDARGGGGFMTGPVDRAAIAKMSRRDASNYIASLREQY